MRRLALLAALFSLGVPAAAHAAFPGANGRIAFSSDRDGNAEIYSMEAGGTGLTRLTTSPGGDVTPDFSPDGDQIAFASDRDGDREIYVMNADGSAPRRVTTNPGVDASPRWSPDGRQLLFESSRSGNQEIVVVNADGTGLTRVTNNNGADQSPSWSPAGDRVAWVSNRDGDFEIFTAAVDGTDGRRLTSNAVNDNDPTWSPDAQTIAFASARTGGVDVYAVPAAGGTATRLTTSTARDSYPAYSPEGNRIAFTSNRDGNVEIYTMATDGGAQTRRTDNGADDGQPTWGRVSATAPPDSGDTAVADVVKGTVKIKIGGGEFVELNETAAIPIGSTLDTTDGTLRLVVSDAAGGTQSGDFYDGVFKLTQKEGQALTDLKLSGGSFKGCPRRRASASRTYSSSVRSLWGKSSGKFRTTAKYASATVRGTKWHTNDRCDGTRIRVTEGSVTVRDKVRRRNVVVRAGKSYLAKRK